MRAALASISADYAYCTRPFSNIYSRNNLNNLYIQYGNVLFITLIPGFYVQLQIIRFG